MFDSFDPALVRTEPIRRNRAALEAYYRSIAGFTAAAGDAPCSAFELSTSADPAYAQAVLEGRALESVSMAARGALSFVLRECAKFAVLWTCGRLWRLVRGAAATRHLRAAQALLVGYVTVRDGHAFAHDFRGFLETELAGQRVATLARRLPQTGLKTYLTACRGDVTPGEACLRWRDLASGLAAGLALRRAVRAHAGTRLAAAVLADVGSGHFMTGWLSSRAALAHILRNVPESAPTCLPMERHDWELLLTRGLRDTRRRVWAVQNCSFSPFDLNMYAGVDGAAPYRNALPDRLYAIAAPWQSVFRELGLDCELRTLTLNRFSGVSFALQLSPGERLLYLGSINLEKVRRDLATLGRLPDKAAVELRLHPSVASMPEAAGFARQRDFSSSYALCVYADTTMVFQLDCDRSRLCFLDHAGFPNQDPAAFFGDWPGKTILCMGTPADAAALAVKLA